MPPDTYWCWLFWTAIHREVNIELDLDRVNLFEDEFERLCHPSLSHGNDYASLGEWLDEKYK
jgi:hypothetical protein